jgi:hypothetical protein
MSSVSGYDANFRNQLDLIFNSTDDKTQTAGVIGKNLAEKEVAVFAAFSDLASAKPEDKATKEQKLQEAQERYRSASRMFELFQQLLKNSDEIIRRVINNMGIR